MVKESAGMSDAKSNYVIVSGKETIKLARSECLSPHLSSSSYKPPALGTEAERLRCLSIRAT